jgi:hypothetical protein
MCDWALLNLKCEVHSAHVLSGFAFVLEAWDRVLHIGPRPLGWDAVRNFSPPVPDRLRWVGIGTGSDRWHSYIGT